MLKTALIDNKTLHITKGKEYKLYYVAKFELVSVINDIGDKVIMSADDFR